METAPVDGNGNAAVAEDQGSQRERVGRAGFAITGFSAAGRLLGFFEAWLLAHYAGGGGAAGAYTAASKLAWGIFGFGEQLLTHSFLPPFVEAREKRGEQSAWRLVSTVGILQLVILLVVVTFTGVLAHPIMGQITRGFTASELSLTARLLRIMLPAVVLMSLASLTYVVLNAYKKFALPAFADAALKGGVVICGFLLWRWLGVGALALGLVLGGFLKLAIHLYGLRGRLGNLRPTLDLKEPGLKKLLVLMVPLMLGNILSLIRPQLDTYFSSAADQVAALGFASKLTSLPFNLIPYALSIALFPFLAEMATRGDREQLGRAVVSALRMVTFLMLPITAVYIVLAHPLVETVYLHGHFTSDDANRVVGPLVWSSIGMLALGIETVVLQIFYSLSDTTTPTFIAYGTFTVYLGVAYYLTRSLTWGAAGVALAFTVSKIAKDGILLAQLWKRLQGVDLRGAGSFLVRLGIATAALSAVLWATLHFGYPAPAPVEKPAVGAVSAAGGTGAAAPAKTTSATTKDHGQKSKSKKGGSKKAVVIFVACSVPGVVVFVLLAWLMKIPELFTIWRVLDNRLRPPVVKLASVAMAPW